MLHDGSSRSVNVTSQCTVHGYMEVVSESTNAAPFIVF